MNETPNARAWVVFLRRWLLPLAAGGLLAVAYPPCDAGQLAWIALIPLLFALERCRSGEAFRRGYIAGLVFFGATVWWTIHVTFAGMVGLIAFLALYFGAAAVWLAWLLGFVRREFSDNAAAAGQQRRDSGWRNLLVAALATSGWISLEWVRGWFLFGGFGWNLLGVSQHEAVPLIQMASVTGVYGVSALVCFFNLALYFTIRRFARPLDGGRGWRLSWELYGAIILICAAFLYGMRTITSGAAQPPARTLQLTLIQGNIPQTLKFVPEERPMILRRYRQLTEEACSAGRPDLIIWPETTTPEAVRFDLDSYGLATNMAARAAAGLLTGTFDYTPYSHPVEAFNAAALVRPDGRIDEVYHKIHLVPFGEYVPLRRIFPFMKWLTPIQDSFERGRDFTVFTLPPFHSSILPSAGPRFSVVICFEDTVPELYRQFVARGVDFMVNVTNDAWFKTSPAAALHLANAVFRAAETHRPLVRATNNGVTCVVDEFGYVLAGARLEPFTEGWLNYELPLPPRSAPTFYTAHGNVFVGGCVVVTVIAVAGFLIQRRRNRGAAWS